MNPQDVPDGPIIVDTDVFSFLYRRAGRWKEFQALLAGHALILSFACLGEALAPTYSRSRPLAKETVVKIRTAVARFVILPYDVDVVERWARLRGVLMNRLKGEGVNDVWTAACALSMGFPVATNNLSDFNTIASEASDLRLVHPDI